MVIRELRFSENMFNNYQSLEVAQRGPPTSGRGQVTTWDLRCAWYPINGI